MVRKDCHKIKLGNYVEIGVSDKKAQVLFIASKRLDEPVSWGGPIVMNTKEELNKAFDDLKKVHSCKRKYHIKSFLWEDFVTQSNY